MDSHTWQSTHLPQTKLLFRNRNRFLSLFMQVICCAMSPYWIAALVYSSVFFFLVFFPLLPAPVPLSKSVNLFQNCMSSVGARAYGSILNQCTPTVCILRRFNFFFPLFADIDGDAPGSECHEGHTVANLNPLYSRKGKKDSCEKRMRWINGVESCFTI